jgi:hypothetical protein
MGWLFKYITQLGIGPPIPADPDPLALWELWIFTLGFFGALSLIVIAILYIQHSEAKEQNIQNYDGVNDSIKLLECLYK